MQGLMQTSFQWMLLYEECEDGGTVSVTENQIIQSVLSQTCLMLMEIVWTAHKYS